MRIRIPTTPIITFAELNCGECCKIEQRSGIYMKVDTKDCSVHNAIDISHGLHTIISKTAHVERLNIVAVIEP